MLLCYRPITLLGKPTVAEKALQHAYKGRKDKRRDFRALWIQRINAGAREHGVKYSLLMHGLREENVQLNRKMLAELAMYEPYSFKALVEQVQYMKGGSGNGAQNSTGSQMNSRTSRLNSKSSSSSSSAGSQTISNS
eukprot:gene13663-13784_t